MRNVLRGIRGPHEGAVFVLGERTVLGRAADADVQVVEPQVSRQHAKLTVDASGRTELVDLSSDNGTFVDEVRVARRTLMPGHTIRIGSSVYRFEIAEDPAISTSAPFDDKVRSSDSFQRTEELPAMPRASSQMSAHARTMSDAMPNSSTSSAAQEAPRRRTNSARESQPGAAGQLSGRWDPHRWIVATTRSDAGARAHPNAEPGPRSIQGARRSSGVPRSTTPLLGWSRSNSLAILRETMEFRELGLRVGRGTPLTEEQRRRHRELESKFLADRNGLIEGRHFQRFACALPAFLHRDVRAPETFEQVVLADISAGGAKLSSSGAAARTGERGLLAIETDRSSSADRLVIPTEIAWISPDGTRVGLKFVGAARMTGRWARSSRDGDR